MTRELDLAKRVAALSPAKRALLERRLQVKRKSSGLLQSDERNHIPGLICFDKATDLPPIFWAPSVGAVERFAECSYLAQLLKDDRSFCTFEPAPEFGEIRTLAEHCVKLMRAKQAHGPYAIVGYCHCGHIAYEMACQLQAQGEETSMLVIMDGSARDFSPNLRQRYYWLRDCFRGGLKTIGPLLFSGVSRRSSVC